MRRLIVVLLASALGAGTALAQADILPQKQVVQQTKAGWLVFRNVGGRQLIYFSSLIAYRCALAEIKYSVNSDTLDHNFPLPPCNSNAPPPPGAPEFRPYLAFAAETAKDIAIRVVFKDGSATEVVHFKPCASQGVGTCARMVE